MNVILSALLFKLCSTFIYKCHAEVLTMSTYQFVRFLSRVNAGTAYLGYAMLIY